MGGHEPYQPQKILLLRLILLIFVDDHPNNINNIHYTVSPLYLKKKKKTPKPLPSARPNKSTPVLTSAPHDVCHVVARCVASQRRWVAPSGSRRRQRLGSRAPCPGHGSERNGLVRGVWRPRCGARTWRMTMTISKAIWTYTRTHRSWVVDMDTPNHL